MFIYSIYPLFISVKSTINCRQDKRKILSLEMKGTPGMKEGMRVCTPFSIGVGRSKGLGVTVSIPN